MRFVLVATAAVLAVCSVALGEIPRVMGYQGRVTDDIGTPVADGNYTMSFRIYDNSGGSGSPLWDSGSQAVALSGGVFSVALGESPQPACSLAFNQDYWMLVTFAGEDQTPLRRLGSVGYAYMASGLVPGTEVSGSVITGTTAALKGINTATTGITYGGWYESASTQGRGVYGKAAATTGNTYGVSGRSDSSSGRGVYGWAVASTGTTYGVYGRSSSTDGRGVYGYALASTGATYGGRFESSSWSGTGVYGEVSATTGTTYGVWGESGSASGAGVYGYASATAGNTYGVSGRSDSQSGRGVYGEASATTGINYAIAGLTLSPSGYAGYFLGDVYVEGNLSKASGSFLIDHPLDPENKLLRHNFVESPENLLIYRGKVRLDADGVAAVHMPGYFKALANEADATVNLTPVGKWTPSQSWPFGYEWTPERDAFTAYGQPGREVSWMVMAERDDPVMRRLARPVEEDKGPDNKYCDRGKLLHPTAYGYPESMRRN
jgi:hypothetical protein